MTIARYIATVISHAGQSERTAMADEIDNPNPDPNVRQAALERMLVKIMPALESQMHPTPPSEIS